MLSIMRFIILFVIFRLFHFVRIYVSWTLFQLIISVLKISFSFLLLTYHTQKFYKLWTLVFLLGFAFIKSSLHITMDLVLNVSRDHSQEHNCHMLGTTLESYFLKLMLFHSLCVNNITRNTHTWKHTHDT